MNKDRETQLHQARSRQETGHIIAYAELQVIDPAGKRLSGEPLQLNQPYILRVLIQDVPAESNLVGQPVDAVFFCRDRVLVDNYRKEMQIRSSTVGETDEQYIDFHITPIASEYDTFAFSIDVYCRHNILSRFRFTLPNSLPTK